jgi:hypothetical protein
MAMPTYETKIYKDEEGYTNIQYHSTVVVRFNDLVSRLYTGGWKTLTTKTRMNQASHEFGLGFHVYQKNGKWYVNHEGKTLEFEEGMTLTRRGQAVLV